MTAADLERELRDLHEATFAWAVTCCDGRRERAEDLLQETYLRVLDGRLAFAGRSSFKTWLFAVVRRAARDHRRRATMRRGLLDRWLEPRGSRVAEQEAASMGRQRARRVRRLLAQLSPRQRQVLELVFFHDLALRQAADVLGISNGSASRHYARGKRALLTRLKETGFDEL